MNRQEWLQWRHKGIGASDSPIIMGKSPWKTRLQLYKEKVQNEPPQEKNNFITDRGNDFEPKVRAFYELLTGETFSPALAEMPEYPFIRASLDGQSVDKKVIIEIKLSGKEDWEKVLQGMVPEKYWHQVQHQLMVTGAEKCVFISYRYEKGKKTVSEKDIAMVDVLPDPKAWEELFANLVKFWDEVKKNEPIPEVRWPVGLEEKIQTWKMVKAQIEEKAEYLEILREEIMEEVLKTGQEKILCNDVRISKITRQGNVEYKKIPELAGVNLDAYRGAPIVSWKMEIAKESKE